MHWSTFIYSHEIYNSFDEGFVVPGVFLVISKPVWCDGLIFKLQRNGISGKLLLALQNFLTSQKQRVVLNTQQSPWKEVIVGVLQGSILGFHLFLIYITNSSEVLNSNPKLFAGDNFLFLLPKI